MTTEQIYKCITCNQEAPDPEQHVCRRQVTAPHDCPERRRVGAELAELGKRIYPWPRETTTTNGRNQEAGDNER